METFKGFGKDEVEDNQHWKERKKAPELSDEEKTEKQNMENDIERFYETLS